MESVSYETGPSLASAPKRNEGELARPREEARILERCYGEDRNRDCRAGGAKNERAGIRRRMKVKAQTLYVWPKKELELREA